MEVNVLFRVVAKLGNCIRYDMVAPLRKSVGTRKMRIEKMRGSAQHAFRAADTILKVIAHDVLYVQFCRGEKIPTSKSVDSSELERLVHYVLNTVGEPFVSNTIEYRVNNSENSSFKLV